MENNRRLREILHSFAQSDYNVLTIYNPHCKESTQRIIIFSNYTSPRQGISEYTIQGQDITDLIESLKTNSFEVPGKVDLGISTKIETIPRYSYVFSPDYSMELIRG